MALLEELKTMGVDVDDGLKRVMGKEGSYIKFLGKFVKMMNEEAVRPDFADAELEETIGKVHSIKGVSGNLSISPVYDAYTEILDQLRNGQIEEAREGIRNVIPVQEKIVKCIQKYME